MLTLIAQNSQDIFGQVEKPPGVAAFDQLTGSSEGIGLLYFISAGIRLATIIAGLYVLLNFITAGYDYITAGDSKASQKVREKLTSSVIGLVIIIASYTIIGVISFIFFGSPTYILNPQICGPEGC